MVRFLHVSSDNAVITKETFNAPELCSGFEQHSYNIDGALYLSKVDDDNPESSMWLRLRQLIANHTDYNKPEESGETEESGDESASADDSEKTDYWLSGTKNYLDFDFEQHKIYVVDSPDDLKQLFIKYGDFDQKPLWKRWYTQKEYAKDELRFQKMKDLPLLIKFIDNLDNATRSQLLTPNPATAAKFEKLIASRNTRNMPFVQIKNEQVVIPKKGITCEFLVDLMRTKQKWEMMITDSPELEIHTTLRSIDFPKMAEAGYNGIYYTTNLVKFNSLADEDTNGKPRKKYVDCASFVVKPDIGEIPDFMPFCDDEDKQKMKAAIEYYIQWLAVDTLMLWRWPF